MNAPAPRTDLAPIADTSLAHVDAAAMILGPSWDRVQSFAKMMAAGAVTVPKHLRGNVGDCTAITLQALTWRMSPFAVAQKTHMTQGGALGYESQLISAVLVSTGAITSEPQYEWIGDWSKILGKVEERKGKDKPDGTEGGKYYVGTWRPQDEEGLGVIVTARLSRDGSERKLKLMLTQAYPRFSTQWATDPAQQLAYLGVRKWARLHSPGSILGVYTTDELETGDTSERFMGPVDEVQRPAAAQPAEYAQAEFDKNFPLWERAISKGKKTAEEIINTVEQATGSKMGAAHKEKIHAVKVVTDATVTTPAPQPAEPKVSPAGEAFTAPGYPEVAEKIARAKDMEQLAEAGSLIAHAGCTDSLKDELRGKYDKRAAELNAQ